MGELGLAVTQVLRRSGGSNPSAPMVRWLGDWVVRLLSPNRKRGERESFAEERSGDLLRDKCEVGEEREFAKGEKETHTIP